eukprot:CAMPEP_0179084102 /NCGR_PEP_ID=MMETSP0796-20121207/38014_1 /TAXON_ID=73915 /ORGANISM="Pyrodinium bahamense, Strain pbaha01" /LENGTH=111 /DNA_ID=CAMNT_0020781517 /DNA_START=719 /DNA_END=1050 /DNA_ORIENTATION=-
MAACSSSSDFSHRSLTHPLLLMRTPQATRGARPSAARHRCTPAAAPPAKATALPAAAWGNANRGPAARPAAAAASSSAQQAKVDRRAGSARAGSAGTTGVSIALPAQGPAA